MVIYCIRRWLTKSEQWHFQHNLCSTSQYKVFFPTGIEPLVLTSFSGYYTNGNPYTPIKDEILIIGSDWTFNIKNLVQTLEPELKAVLVHDLYTFYSLENLASHRAIIFLPYSVMSYKLTELYSLSIPMFVPSPRFLARNKGLGADRTSTSQPYCSEDPGMTLHSLAGHRLAKQARIFSWLNFSSKILLV